MSWREWFKECGKRTRSILPEGFVNAEEEARYEAYKARLIEELAVQTDELLRPAELVEKPASPPPWY